MKKDKKQEAVKTAEKVIGEAKVAVVTDYRGMNVAEMNKLRRKLKESGVDYRVVKNNLAAIAAKNVGKEGLKELLVGPSAVAFGYTDEIAPAKVLAEYIRTTKPPLTIRGALLQTRVLTADEVAALALMPPREQLVAKLVGQIKSPLYSLVTVLNGNLAGLARVLQARMQQLEGGSK
ncbi:MAG: 50S ribosomal protein L10 [Dehalococcoidia bacterium]|nr:50S ribosomal protein L10 [Dehalococcoidia bacterium]